VGCSILHLLLLFAFAALKLGFVVTKFNPQVSVFDDSDQHLTEEAGINMDDPTKDKFMIGLTIVDAASGEIKHDPKYV
jgi:anionic cell wall polymer biosynthesis LytR-Cps2A-Psr (LCP) family protein